MKTKRPWIMRGDKLFFSGSEFNLNSGKMKSKFSRFPSKDLKAWDDCSAGIEMAGK